ncbi:MAG: histidinol phosphatase [Acidobacteria bacterium]|nr:histidinol phosphatase [Acidobacteriota bacterium]
MAYERELAAVQRWLDECGPVALTRFRVGVPSETKTDGSPVTEADRAIEEALRTSIGRDFPRDEVLGEETGTSGSGARRWILDPIDGTRNYRRGVPIFASMIALEDDGRLALGAVDAPALGLRWWATHGGGAFRGGEPIRVSGVSDLAAAEIASGGIEAVRAAGLLDGLLALAARAERHRGWGDFWGHMLVAQGSVDLMLDPLGLGIWDVAAPKLIVEEAGGRATGVAGEDRLDAGSLLTTNGLLHESVLTLLARGDGPRTGA